MRSIYVLCLVIFCSVVYGNAEPTIESCYKKLDEILRNNETLEEQLQAWQSCRSFCPNDGAFEGQISALYGAYKKHQEALQYLSVEVKKYPNKIPKRLLYAVGDVYGALGHLEGTKEVAELLIKDYENWHGGYRLLGMYHLENKNYQKAFDYFSTAVNEKEEGKDAWNYMSLVRVHYALGNYTQAVRAFDFAIDNDIRVAYLRRNATSQAAIAMIKTNRLEDARNVLVGQAKVDKEAPNLPAYQEAVRLYEQVAGEPLGD